MNRPISRKARTRALYSLHIKDTGEPMKIIEWNAIRNCHSNWVDQLTAMSWPTSAAG